MNRSEIQNSFVGRFSQPPRKSVIEVPTMGAISRIQEDMTVGFPVSYVSFITAYGPVHTPEILDLVVSAQESGSSSFEGWDVASFLVPAEIPKIYAMYVKGGMDSVLIPFAGDSSGNLFGFSRTEMSKEHDDLPVLFFDHEFCEVHVEEKSFDAWLERFLAL